MRKSDMYIDYGSGRGGRPPSFGRILAIILVVVLACGMGFGGYIAAKYYSGAMKEQDPDAAASPTPTSFAEGGDGEADLTGAAAETGIYGLWYSPKDEPGEVESIYDNLDGEVWMKDFVDTRTRVDSRGIYLSAQKFNSKLEDALKLIEATELNTVVVDIKSDYGSISYQMNSTIAKEAKAL